MPDSNNKDNLGPDSYVEFLGMPDDIREHLCEYYKKGYEFEVQSRGELYKKLGYILIAMGVAVNIYPHLYLPLPHDGNMILLVLFYLFTFVNIVLLILFCRDLLKFLKGKIYAYPADPQLVKDYIRDWIKWNGNIANKESDAINSAPTTSIAAFKVLETYSYYEAHNTWNTNNRVKSMQMYSCIKLCSWMLIVLFLTLVVHSLNHSS